LFGYSGALDCTTFNLNGGTATIPGVLLDSGTPVLFFSPPPGASEPTFNYTAGTLVTTNTNSP
jgi:hypothetical protein